MPASLFPHLAVSCASFILSAGMVTGTHNGLYCWNKPPWKTSGTYTFLPKGKCGSWLAKKYVKSCREGGKSRTVGVLNPIPIYCQGLSWPTIQPYCIPVLGLFKSASLPWHKQTELIECLPLAYFGNFMECVRAWIHFRPLLITWDVEEIIEAWGEDEEAKPVAKGY